MKKYDKEKFHRKFSSYKTVFAIFFALLILSFILGVWLEGRGRVPFARDLVSSFLNGGSLSRRTVLFEIFFLLLIFVFAPTIYSPTASFTAVFLYGFLMGVGIATLSSHRLFIGLSLGFLSAYLLVVYSTLGALVGINLFSKSEKPSPRLFDGVMFRCDNFSTFFNFRFVLSHIAIFLFFSLVISAISLLKVFLICL